MKPSRTEKRTIDLSKTNLQMILNIVDGLEDEFPHEWELDDLEQESLEVALDDVVVKLIKKKVLPRKFAIDRTFTEAFAAIFDGDASIVNLAKKLQSSTSEYTDEFSPHVARASFDALTQALKEKIDGIPESK